MTVMNNNTLGKILIYRMRIVGDFYENDGNITKLVKYGLKID